MNAIHCSGRSCTAAVSATTESEGCSTGGTMLPLGAAMVAGLLLTSGVRAEDQTLPTVTVNAASEQPDGLRATKTRVGKVVQDPHDVPQAVTTLTRALMDEQKADSLKEALRNVSGLTFNAAEGGRSGDNMMLRGYYTYGDMYLDGIRDTAQYNREVFNLEQVDVLRGAAAMLFGRGQAGGVINLVSKTPSLYGGSSVSTSLGSHGYQEVKGDFNQRLGEDAAFRLNLMARDDGSWRQNPRSDARPETHREGIAPSLALGLGGPHEVTLSHLQLKTYDRPDYGVPFDSTSKRPSNAWPSNYYWGVAGNFDNSETNITTLSHLFRLAADTQWRTQIRNASYQRAYWAAAPSPPGSGPTASGVTGGNNKTRQTDTDNFVIQSDFSTQFKALGMSHELLTGVELLKEDSKRWTLRNLGSTTDPFYRQGQLDAASRTTYKGDTLAYYLQDSVEFLPQWKATLGLRRDELKADYSLANAPHLEFKEMSYRAGLSWQPDVVSHYYLSWSDSFSPTADLYQLSGATYPAERGRVSELGGKWLLLDGDLAFRSALYRADKDWERNTDLESSAAILTRKRRVEGLEFELAGRINHHWEVFSGLSFMRGWILAEAPGASTAWVGQRPRNTPKATFNLWTTYTQGPWKYGIGLEAKAARSGYVPTAATLTSFDPNTAPGYARWDALVSYEQKSYSVKLNVQNLLNKVYYDAIYDNGGFTVPGPRARAILSTEFKF